MKPTEREMQAISQYNREAQAKSRARALGLDPEQLDFDPDQCPLFSARGTPKSIESTAVARLLEKRWHEQQAGAKKKSTRSAA